MRGKRTPRQLRAALIAVLGAQVILMTTFVTVPGQFTTGHRHEGTVDAINDFEITDDKTMIECYRTESAEAVLRIFHQFDADFGYFHVPTLPNRSRVKKRLCHKTYWGR